MRPRDREEQKKIWNTRVQNLKELKDSAGMKLLRGAVVIPDTEEVFRSAAWPVMGLLRSLSTGETLWRLMWRPQKPLA